MMYVFFFFFTKKIEIIKIQIKDVDFYFTLANKINK